MRCGQGKHSLLYSCPTPAEKIPRLGLETGFGIADSTLILGMVRRLVVDRRRSGMLERW